MAHHDPQTCAKNRTHQAAKQQIVSGCSRTVIRDLVAEPKEGIHNHVTLNKPRHADVLTVKKSHLPQSRPGSHKTNP
jgi:hypothetical protein